MTLSLEHDALKADPEGAARALGLVLTERIGHEASANGRVVRTRTLEAALPRDAQVSARFVREGLIERAKKLFHDEVEVGSSTFDDHVYVITSTPELTRRLLEKKRAQVALILLVDETRHVELLGNVLRVVDDHAPDDGRDAKAELLALAACALE